MCVVPYGLSDSQPCNPHVVQHAIGVAITLFLAVPFLLRKGHPPHACRILRARCDLLHSGLVYHATSVELWVELRALTIIEAGRPDNGMQRASTDRIMSANADSERSVRRVRLNGHLDAPMVPGPDGRSINANLQEHK